MPVTLSTCEAYSSYNVQRLGWDNGVHTNVGIMTIHEFVELAMSFDGAEESPHFDRRAFKVRGKRIFTTLHEASETVNVKLNLADQKIFSEFDKKSVYPVPNKWGLQGWTTFHLKAIPEYLMLDVLSAAHGEVMAKKPK